MSPEARVRRSAALLAGATLILVCVTATYLEFETRSAHMTVANLPLMALLPFVYWLLGNTLLKRFFPRLSLSTAELRIVLCVLWVGGLFAGYNWATQWVGVVTAPHYYASPENRWEELIFDYLPWWMYPPDFPGVVKGFYLGLGEGEALPWGAWIAPIFWAGSAALAMTAIGLGLTAIFQKQWANHERLTYPLAQVSLDLTEGFDRRRGWPPFVRNRMFWVGFGAAALPLLWNIIEYWAPGFPRIAIWDPYFSPTGQRVIAFSRYLWPFSYRLLPMAIGFLFLCDLNILFSLWSLFLVGQVMLYGMKRVGFSVGLGGQEATPEEVIGLFTHGVMMALVIWAVWAARGHLKRVFRQVLRHARDEEAETVILSPRGTAVALLGGALYMVFWLHGAGYSLTAAVVWLGLFWASILAVMKFLAASGFAYMYPNWGTAIPEIWVGTSGMLESTQVAMRLVNWRLLAGWRLPPALPHVTRLMGRGRRIGWLVLGSATLGLVSAILYTIWICYEKGGSGFQVWSLVGAPRGMYDGIADIVANTDRSVPDPGKIAVWTLGGLAAIAATVLQTRLPWWPIHPLGLMLMLSGDVWRYVLDIFLTWLAKLVILQYGGIALYRRVRPCSYGLIVGYAFAVGCSLLVDLIWFPEGGHYIHGY